MHSGGSTHLSPPGALDTPITARSAPPLTLMALPIRISASPLAYT